ncbi:hypothetical protein QTG54_008396 [Skeletonema marinoi]|uniref:Uncharacterized protein n=1 Tax=Skeletonema marinoi TaxID=267567 RepID=A0AAD8Y7D2_9STRA|nr:hypothetical protein QTG54_008396 [Skeletonema marinoi]
MSTHDPVISTKAACNRRTPPKFSSRKLTAFYFFILTVVFMCGRHLLLRPPSVKNNSNNTKSSASSTTEITPTTNSNSTTIIIPPLKDLIDKNGKVISDISWMLDFAIIGFPKSGTSFLKNYLNQTDETRDTPPVMWFESFYNYQVGRNVSLPASTSSLIGCTDRARFHAALARLRKTPLVEKEEVDLLFGTRYEGNYTIPPLYILLNNNDDS